MEVQEDDMEVQEEAVSSCTFLDQAKWLLYSWWRKLNKSYTLKFSFWKKLNYKLYNPV